MPDIKKIRSALEMQCNGMAKMTDQQIMLTWSELPPDTKTEYLASVKPKAERKIKDADNTGRKDV